MGALPIAAALKLPPRPGPVTAQPSKPATLPDWKHAVRPCPLNPAQQPIPAEWLQVRNELKAALQKALAANRWPIYLHGHAGRGKTSAAAAVFRHWPKPFVCWWDAGQVVRDLVRARVDGGAGRILRTVGDADLIALDDVGTREPTGAQLDALLAIVNARGQKPLIVTGNHRPAELAEMLNDDRIASRLCAGVVIEVAGDDRRLLNALVLEA